MIRRTPTWKIFLIELLSVFIEISLAFALNNWSNQRKENPSEAKILSEIKNGLPLQPG